ncbi:MAG: magnesium/cobalt transporter CorA [Vampirovibrionales bacterium]|nr:magnesium/cobalt transporter CorA [Vampirovibrionales bacterium]
MTPFTDTLPDKRARISVTSYDAAHIDETPDCLPGQALARARAHRVGWIRVKGLEDVNALNALGHALEIHPLALEDIHHPDQRPKVDVYDHGVLITLRTLRTHRPESGRGPGLEAVSEQLAMVLGDPVLTTFLERRDDELFESLQERLRDEQSFTRKQGVDYLAYRLMDIVVDQYFQVLEAFGEELDALSDGLTREQPDPALMKRIQGVKAEMMTLRRAVWPLREVVGSLQRGDSALISEQTRVYLRDLQDHLTYVAETIDTYREMIAGMLDIYLSQINFRINQQIKVMTIIATIFMPLSFIAGVYGMNFHYMPELYWRFGYPAVWLVMIAMTAGMLIWFRAKRWF